MYMYIYLLGLSLKMHECNKMFTIPAHKIFPKCYVMTVIQKEVKVAVFIFAGNFEEPL